MNIWIFLLQALGTAWQLTCSQRWARAPRSPRGVPRARSVTGQAATAAGTAATRWARNGMGSVGTSAWFITALLLVYSCLTPGWRHGQGVSPGGLPPLQGQWPRRECGAGWDQWECAPGLLLIYSCPTLGLFLSYSWLALLYSCLNPGLFLLCSCLTPALFLSCSCLTTALLLPYSCLNPVLLSSRHTGCPGAAGQCPVQCWCDLITLSSLITD